MPKLIVTFQHRWTITCTIPQPPQPSDSSEEDEDEDDEEEEEEEEEDGEEEEDLLRGRNRDYDLPQFRPGELVDEPAQGRSPTRNQEILVDLSPTLTSIDIKPFYTAAKLRLHSPTPATIPLTNRQLRGSLPARFPTPPPPDDQLGPAARYPFLNYQGKADEMASPDNYQSYSCRPGGPRLFDLLNTMDLGEFGVLSWIIVDREEEIYEIDDVRDEDKVMLALWNRWIFMNRWVDCLLLQIELLYASSTYTNAEYRKSFIFKGFDNGIESFIEDHWRIIHLAAGWGALRAFLLVSHHCGEEVMY